MCTTNKDNEQQAYLQYDIWVADIPIVAKSRCVNGTRPVIIISNDVNNNFSELLTVIPITSNTGKRRQPTHVYIEGCGMERPGIALCENMMPLDKHRLIKRVGSAKEIEDKLNKAVLAQITPEALYGAKKEGGKEE